MQTLMILNDSPYGSGRPYHALRLANALVKADPANGVTVFFLADAVGCVKKGQKTPEDYFNIERMLKRLRVGKHPLLVCASCMDARGLSDAELIDGARRSSMDELAAVTVRADKVLVF